MLVVGQCMRAHDVWENKRRIKSPGSALTGTETTAECSLLELELERLNATQRTTTKYWLLIHVDISYLFSTRIKENICAFDFWIYIYKYIYFWFLEACFNMRRDNWRVTWASKETDVLPEETQSWVSHSLLPWQHFSPSNRFELFELQELLMLVNLFAFI